MRRSIGWILTLLVLASLVAGCRAEPRRAPVQVPSSTAPSTAGPGPGPAPGTKPAGLPGDKAALDAALAAKSPFHYEILLVDDTGGRDPDAYLDWLMAERKWPEESWLLLVLFSKENYDLRFAMGADFFAKNITVDEMIALMRSAYFPKGSKNDPAGGLADLIRAVNSRVGAS